MNEKKKVGRPKKKVDLVLGRDLAREHCTIEEIAAAMKVSHDTLERNEIFMAMYRQEIQHAKRSVRRMLWDLASDKDVDPKVRLSANIWLSKNYLAMSERAKLDATIEVGEKPVKIDIRSRIKEYEEIFNKQST